MVNRSLLKEIFNFIRLNSRVFISQVLIVMLGVGFFIGIKVSVVDLKSIMSNFVNNNEMYDFVLTSDYGVGKEDVVELKNLLSNVKYMEGSYSQDMVINVDGVNSVLRIHSYSSEKSINKLKVLKGSLPDKKNECVIDIQLSSKGYKIGDTITLDNDYLEVKVLNITGIVQSPSYLAFTRGNSMLLSGSIDYYVYVNEINVLSDIYTELYVRSTPTPPAFTKKYNEYLIDRQEQIASVVTDYFKKKFEDYKEEKQQEIDEARKKLDTSRKETELEISKYENEIMVYESQILEAEQKIKSEEQIKDIVESKIKEALGGDVSKEELDALKKKRDAAQAKYNKRLEELEAKNNSNSVNIPALNAEIGRLESEITALDEQQMLYQQLVVYLKDYGYTENKGWGGKTTYNQCTSWSISCGVWGQKYYASKLEGYETKKAEKNDEISQDQSSVNDYKSEIRKILKKHGISNDTCLDSVKNNLIKVNSCYKELGVDKNSISSSDRNTIYNSVSKINSLEKSIASKQKEIAELDQLKQQSDAVDAQILSYENTIKQNKQDISTKELEITNLRNSIKNAASGNNIYDDPLLKQLKKEFEELDNEYNKKLLVSEVTQDYDELYSQLFSSISSENEMAKAELDRYKSLLNTKKSELEEYKKVLNQELKKAEDDLIDAQHTLDQYEYPRIYFANRNDNSGYSQFSDDISTISNLGQIIPIIFYLISFFMISSSVSKIVFEERNQIGTLKALGFNNQEIKSKYFIYSIFIVIIGSILGIGIGTYTLPAVIYKIYGVLYEFPPMIYTFDLVYILLAVGIAFIVAISSTVLSCHNTLKEMPISLLKLNPERFSKSTFFERFPIIWENLSFSTRIALKNVFRYKTRVFMTVIGIGGCLALILTGLSLRTSIGETIPMQYGKVFKIDAQIFFSDEALQKDINQLTEKILEMPNIENALPANYITMTTKSGNKNIDISVVTISNDNYLDFILLEDPATDQPLILDQNGAIISEKLANTLKVKKGEFVTIKDGKNKEYKIEIAGIAKNYVSHYIYMNDDYYASVFWNIPRNNALFIKTTGEYEELKLAEEINSLGNISQIMFVSAAQELYEEIMNVLSILVLIITVFSLLLVFAVLYNLINMNVRERTREIATYKVLGFSDSVVCSILKKENSILLVFGLIFGVIFGRYLALVVIKMVEIEKLSFIKNITNQNYLISILLTVVFTYLFSLLINMYVKKISLTESLKKNE